MAATPLPRRTPPPASIAKDFPELNRWLLDLIQLVSPAGGIDPGSITGSIVINGNGPPASGLGANGDIYLNNTGTNNVINTGLAAEGAGLADLSSTRLYAKIGGVWVPIG